MPIPDLPEDLRARFDVTDVIGEDGAFRFLRATRITGGQAVFLQMVQEDIPGICRSPLRKYFAGLKEARGLGLFIHVESYDKDNNMFFVYEDKHLTLATDSVPADDGEFMQFCTQAGNALRALHSRKIVHGCPGTMAWVMVNGKVNLGRFGYAPLLIAKLDSAMKSCNADLAPEARSGNLTSVSDCYSFALAICTWRPSLLTTAWCKKATDPDPARRFDSVDNLIRALEAELGMSAGEPVIEAPFPEPFIEEVEEEIPAVSEPKAHAFGGRNGTIEPAPTPLDGPSAYAEPAPSGGIGTIEPAATPLVETEEEEVIAEDVGEEDQNAYGKLPPTTGSTLPYLLVGGVVAAMAIVGWLVTQIVGAMHLH